MVQAVSAAAPLWWLLLTGLILPLLSAPVALVRARHPVQSVVATVTAIWAVALVSAIVAIGAVIPVQDVFTAVTSVGAVVAVQGAVTTVTAVRAALAVQESSPAAVPTILAVRTDVPL